MAGNQVPRSVPQPYPAHPFSQTLSLRPAPKNNMGQETPYFHKKKTVINCNEAAERYGGVVVTEYGGGAARNKPAGFGLNS